MEKLIIKNFGAIKNAEIDIKKYNLIIGDTSIGKSTIAKLICIFRNLLVKGVANIDNFKKELERYGIPFLDKTSEIVYHYKDDFFVHIKNEEIIDKKNSRIVREYINTVNKENKHNRVSLSNKGLEEFYLATIEFLSKISPEEDFFKNQMKEKPLYIPAERMYFSVLGNSIAGLWANNVNVPQAFLDFAGHIEKAKQNISELRYEPLDLTYHKNKTKDYVIINGVRLNIEHTSSGVQALLPLVMVLNDIEKESYEKMVCIEEPEISLFPQRQKQVVEHIVASANEKSFSVVITTHSPYVLSAFDNLIMAYNVAQEKPHRAEEVHQIISKEKWISYEEVSAYELKDGTLISLMEEEYKGLNTNAIDQVSNELGKQLDKLLDLRYEE